MRRLGNLLALDASTGTVLKRIDAHGALNNGLISYAVDSTQYVAAEVGEILVEFPGDYQGRCGSEARYGSRFFGLSSGGEPKFVQADRVPQDGATAEDKGYSLFHGLCYGCHGFPATGGFNYPVLLRQSHILTDPKLIENLFETISPPMPKLYPGLLTDDDVRSLVSFLRTLNLPFSPGTSGRPPPVRQNGQKFTRC